MNGGTVMRLIEAVVLLLAVVTIADSTQSELYLEEAINLIQCDCPEAKSLFITAGARHALRKN